MQNYTEIPSTAVLTASRQLFLNNDKSIMSCFSGTAYPTTNLQLGMLCFRTDSGKLFQLTSAAEKTWVEIADTKQDITASIESKFPLAGGTVVGVAKFTAKVESTSKTTGSVVVTGGLGVSGNIYASDIYAALKGNADTATKLATARSISLGGALTSKATLFQGNSDIIIPITKVSSEYLTGVINPARLEGMYGINISGTAATANWANRLADFSNIRNSAIPWLVTCSAGPEGTTGVGRYLHFNGNNTTTRDPTVRLDAGAEGSTLLRLTGHFVASGNVTAYSDRRLKDNIERIESALTKVQALNGVTFTRTDLDDKAKRYVGLIAQEVQLVVPQAITALSDDNGTETLSVDYQGLVGLLIEAIKEISADVTKLKETSGVIKDGTTD